jgi:hypothetical protein
VGESGGERLEHGGKRGDGGAAVKKPTMFDRGYRHARRNFVLTAFIENGERITVTNKMRDYIQWHCAFAWKAGYQAGKRESAK